MVSHPYTLCLEQQVLPPVDDTPIDIPSDAPLTLVGPVSQIIDGLVIVQAQDSGEHSVLDADSVLVTQDRQVVGRVGFTAFLQYYFSILMVMMADF